MPSHASTLGGSGGRRDLRQVLAVGDLCPSLTVRGAVSRGAAALAVLCAAVGPASAAPPPARDDLPITHQVGSPLPPSVYTSAETAAVRDRLDAELRPLAERVVGVDTFTPEGALTMRAVGKEIDERRASRMLAVFPVAIADVVMGGVQTRVVTPPAVAPRNRERVLISLHGGGFYAGTGSVWEAIPIASVGQVKVVAVDYRMAPEFRFPAATEDVVAVYRELLKTHRPENIGIYGCSAGALLTAQAITAFQTLNLPRPGAAALDSGAAISGVAGDSVEINRRLSNQTGPGLRFLYMKDADARAAAASPAFYPEILARFPPTLVVTGTRDIVLSQAVYTHARLVAAGVDSRLHVWEGAGHCFTAQFETAEAREAYGVMTRFFDQNLSRRTDRK